MNSSERRLYSSLVATFSEEKVVDAGYDIPERGEVFDIVPGIVCLRMPLPFSLDHINIYLIEDDDGWTVIDCGVAGAETEAVWHRIIAEQLHNKPIKQIIITHAHADHIGCAAWLAERYQISVRLAQLEYEELKTYFARKQKRSIDEDTQFKDFYHALGFSEPMIRRLYTCENRLTPLFGVLPKVAFFLQQGMSLEIGGRKWKVLTSSGHSRCHCALYCERDRILISGDQILPLISSNVSVTLADTKASPLSNWLRGLQEMTALADNTLVLPAHDNPFYGLHRRVSELQHSYLQKADSIILEGRQLCTVNELIEHCHGSELSDFNRILAAGELQAYLNYLHGEGGVKMILDDNGQQRWFIYRKKGEVPL